jgi:hypothetical protein
MQSTEIQTQSRGGSIEVIKAIRANPQALKSTHETTKKEAYLFKLPSWGTASNCLTVSFGLTHFAATVKAGWADMVAQMNFTCGGLHRNTWGAQRIVAAMHAALRRRFFVLLNGHD